MVGNPHTLSAMAVALCAPALISAPAHAQSPASPARLVGDAPAAAEPQPADKPPAPLPKPAPRTLEMDAGQRRAIRGCPVTMNCQNRRAAGLIEFELRGLPDGGGDDPWVESRTTRVARPSSAQKARPKWLDGIAMPDLPVRWHPRVIKYLRFFTKDRRGRALMAHWLKDQDRYRALILDELRKARLPEDLLYVAMIESSYNPREKSYAGAVGLWQFMPAGGEIYGLEQSRWVDERRDPVLSTRAVVQYWSDLYHRFGEWHLALAAFNAGYGAVLQSQAKYNTNDFWRLINYENGLPYESGLYVPRILAAAIIGRNRRFFGFDEPRPGAGELWDQVAVPASLSVDVIARAAGVEPKAIRDLNPQLRLDRTPPGKVAYQIRVPAGRARLFQERLPQIKKEWDLYDAYTVQAGERLEDIATVHGLGVRRLRKLNGIRSTAEISGGSVLLVPKLSTAAKRRNRARAEEILYASGEPRGKKGDKLIVPVLNPEAGSRGRERAFYRVVSGDTLIGVARKFEVERALLARWNGLHPEAHLQARMILEVWVDDDFDAEERGISLLDEDRLLIVRAGSAEHLDLAEERKGRKRFLFRAKKAMNFEQVGKRFGLTSRDLARINRRPHDTVLAPGESILVYKVVDTKSSTRAAEQEKARRQNQPKRSSRRSPKRSRRRATKPGGPGKR